MKMIDYRPFSVFWGAESKWLGALFFVFCCCLKTKISKAKKDNKAQFETNQTCIKYPDKSEKILTCTYIIYFRTASS